MRAHCLSRQAFAARLIGFIAVVLLAAACRGQQADFGAALAAGKTALDSGNYAEAETRFREAVAVEPGSADAQFGLGNALVRQGKLEDAEAAYQAVLAIDPSMSSAHANLGVVYYQQNDLVRAGESFKAALEISPGDAQSLYHLAAVRIQENDLTEAETLLNQARDLDPGLAEVYYGLGVLYKLTGRQQDAIAAFERFIEVGPGQDRAAMDYAKAELEQLKGQ